MDIVTIIQLVQTVGSLGILGVYFLYTQPQLFREQLATFEKMALLYHQVSTDQRKEFQAMMQTLENGFNARLQQALSAVDDVCRYKG